MTTNPNPRHDRQRQLAILKAARTVFLRDGFNGASIAAIQTLAGGSKSTIYQYFGNKAGLFAAVVKYQCDQSMGEFNLDDLSGEIEDILLQVGRMIARTLTQPDSVELMRIVIGSAQQFPELGRHYYEFGPGAAVSLFTPLFQRHLNLSPEHARFAAAQFAEMIKAPLHLKLLFNTATPSDYDSLDTEVTWAVRAFLQGFSNLGVSK